MTAGTSTRIDIEELSCVGGTPAYANIFPSLSGIVGERFLEAIVRSLPASVNS